MGKRDPLNLLRGGTGPRHFIPPSPAPARRPPKPSFLATAVRSALRIFTTRRRPVRQKVQLEALEPRLLLSAELPVVPPPPQENDSQVLAAPLEFGAAESQQLGGPIEWDTAPRVERFDDDWGERVVESAGNAQSLTLDFSNVTRDLTFTVLGDSSVTVTDGTNTATAGGVAKIISGAGNDRFVFQGMPGPALVLDTSRGADALDFSALSQDLTLTTHADGSMTVTDGVGEVTTMGAATAVGGQGVNTWVVEKPPVVAGMLNGGVFTQSAAEVTAAAYAQAHAAPMSSISRRLRRT